MPTKTALSNYLTTSVIIKRQSTFWRALSKWLLNTDSIGINHLSRKPVAVFDHPHGRKWFLNICSESPLVQLCAVPTCTVIDSQGEVTSPLPLLRELQRAAKSSLSLLFFQTRQLKCPQPSLTGHAFCPFY